MNIETKQNARGRWYYVLVTRDGRQMGWSQNDYASDREARERGEAFNACSRSYMRSGDKPTFAELARAERKAGFPPTLND